ncbi:barstar family protein [Novosphingobium flavum]|uniref:Barstar family protein n=1 Tax=Novosphingobium aerophilum TaxID=2839843 RepID=A0A7X1KBR0_9SPHN|nr:barstar family protein [Novosphingobium aerophilum]
MLDGEAITSLEAFYDAVSVCLVPDIPWGRNLNAFNDLLRGGFGTPDEGFVLQWTASGRSREALGYPETVRQLQGQLKRCDPSFVAALTADLERAERGEGLTVFDWLVDIIRDHGPGGTEARDNVHLILA